MDDASFLQAIFDAPDDVATRLVYADWLEERGDIRGELLRARAALAGMPAEARGRKELAEHERELVPRCDERWLVLLERAEWRNLYDELEPRGKHRSRWKPDQQDAIGAALAAFEAEFEHRLPRSYKAFAHVFGPGEMAEYFRFNVPTLRKRDIDDLAERQRDIRRSCLTDWTGPEEWLRRALFIGATIGGEMLVLDTNMVTEATTPEYRVCWLNGRDKVHRSADTFMRFIEDVCMKVFEGHEEETLRMFRPY